ncbi:mechanosensitive ion channel family protein [Rhizosphaericola mali]|uniref:Mechanosensitive ion channel n=1 Tax=Rhizosphaericola mali TaxID=2545455 RepID=A0A5P2G7E6_9BACT|nr:mechanosensitive ion channel domain-containing protein [Rhizosphaericola mali]QES90618.1 mechanosensitive ion channel [Rhizosphaericola mali]
MADFLEKIGSTEILDNHLKSILIAVATILIAFFIRKLLSRFIANLIFKFLSKDISTQYKSNFDNYIVARFGRFLFWFITIASLNLLTPPSDLKSIPLFGKDLVYWGDALLRIVLIYSFINLAIGVVYFIFSIYKVHSQKSGNKSALQLFTLLGDLSRIVLIIIGVLMSIKIGLGYSIQGLLTNISLVTAALALAAKESLENLIASFIIFLDKPFYIGDYVTVSGVSGTVEAIGLRSTRLRTANKTLVTVPNKQMVDTLLDNVSQRSQYKFSEKLEISLSATSDDLIWIKEQITNLLSEKNALAISVYLQQTGSSAHFMYLEYYINVGDMSSTDFNNLTGEVNREIVAMFQQHDIHFAQESSTVVSIQQSSN